MSQVLTSRPERTVDPTFEPVTVAEMRKQVGLADSCVDHDGYLASLIAAAREKFEADTDLVCCTSTWRERFDEWPDDDYFTLGKRPVASVSSLTYIDSNGTAQTWSSANYSLDSGRGMPAVVLAYDVSFPTQRGDRNSIVLTYVAGKTAITMAASWKHAIKALAGHWFENRIAVQSGTIVTSVPLLYESIVANNQRPTYP